ncbi:MAG: nickel-dependent hydrogenase large subunit [Candidatus Micrarchaeota archaeon]
MTTEAKTKSGMKIPVGPIHPALEEPLHFMFTVDGERIIDVDFRLGYNHRGIEKLMESKDFNQGSYLAEHICGICSYTHSCCYVQNVEKIGSVEVPPRARYVRTIVCEMERVHSHLLWAGIAGEEIGHKSLFMYAMKARELIMDSLEEITGNRVNHGINRVGGVRYPIESGHVGRLIERLTELYKRTEYLEKIFLKDPIVEKRVAGVGVLTKEEAKKFCTVGPTARASGVDIDVRRDDPYFAYGELDFDVITWDSGDVLGRAAVRILELKESIKIIEQALRQMPGGPFRNDIWKIPKGEAISRTEAPRGEDLHYMRTEGGNKPTRYKVRTPTLANIVSVPAMFKDAQIADIPIIVASIDPCIGCMDRVSFIDERGTNRYVSFRDLRGIRRK